MKQQLLTLSLGIGVILISTQQVFGQTGSCAKHDAVVARLANAYGETRQSIGLDASNSMIEVFASDETGTWTITVTTPNGMSCLIASGQAFEKLADDLTSASASDT